jgi:hypothetical protein
MARYRGAWGKYFFFVFAAFYVLDRLRERATSKAKTPNLGKIVNDILEKAGMPKWSKPFVSIRESAETDLAETFPIQRSYNLDRKQSESCPKAHYLRVLPSHYEQAIKSGAFSGKKGLSEHPLHAGNYGVSPHNFHGANYRAAHAGNGLQ